MGVLVVRCTAGEGARHTGRAEALVEERHTGLGAVVAVRMPDLEVGSPGEAGILLAAEDRESDPEEADIVGAEVDKKSAAGDIGLQVGALVVGILGADILAEGNSFAVEAGVVAAEGMASVLEVVGRVAADCEEAVRKVADHSLLYRDVSEVSAPRAENDGTHRLRKTWLNPMSE